MKIFKSSQVSFLDKDTIKNEPISSIDLMERASLSMLDFLRSKYNTDQDFCFVIGPGNNGGDGLAMARFLSQNGYEVSVFILRLKSKLSIDSEEMLSRLIKFGGEDVQLIRELNEFPKLNTDVIIIDALFGSGLSRSLNGLSGAIVKKINSLSNRVISVDIPSGLFGENNSDNSLDAIIKADITLSLQFPNISFFMPDMAKFVGEYRVLPIGIHSRAIEENESMYYTIDAELVKEIHKPRMKFAHKGNFGHALLCAGSYGMMGAAILSAKSCLRSGVGLLTSHIVDRAVDLMQISVPEAIVSVDNDSNFLSIPPDLNKYSAIGLGPGIGQNEKSQAFVSSIIKTCELPIVIDADALNCISLNKALLNQLPKYSVLTPHVKEFERLFGACNSSFARLEKQIGMSKKYSLCIVLKGAHSSITTPDGLCYFNTTGNQGMATAGSGDVLTGIILALLSQGYTPEDASILGVFIHGLSGDIALEDSAYESIIASDLITNLGSAFRRTFKKH